MYIILLCFKFFNFIRIVHPCINFGDKKYTKYNIKSYKRLKANLLLFYNCSLLYFKYFNCLALRFYNDDNISSECI